MNITCGTDIIEISRIKDSIENKGKVFLDKIYTLAEIEYCENRRNAKYQHYAGRFAAKEAIFKAISETLENKYDIAWTDVEIINVGDSKAGEINGALCKAAFKDILSKLQNGEKIDVVLYSEEPEEYIKNALSPAKNAIVNITDATKKEALAVVNEDQLSLAIGKGGNNIKLASRLTRYKINIKTMQEINAEGNR